MSLTIGSLNSYAYIDTSIDITWSTATPFAGYTQTGFAAAPLARVLCNGIITDVSGAAPMNLTGSSVIRPDGTFSVDMKVSPTARTCSAADEAIAVNLTCTYYYQGYDVVSTDFANVVSTSPCVT